jgi:hypothetical protein
MESQKEESGLSAPDLADLPRPARGTGLVKQENDQRKAAKKPRRKDYFIFFATPGSGAFALKLK